MLDPRKFSHPFNIILLLLLYFNIVIIIDIIIINILYSPITVVTIIICLYSFVTFLLIGARCSSGVRAFAHGAMGRRIDPSWGGPIELFLVPASAPRLV